MQYSVVGSSSLLSCCFSGLVVGAVLTGGALEEKEEELGCVDEVGTSCFGSCFGGLSE